MQLHELCQTNMDVITYSSPIGNRLRKRITLFKPIPVCVINGTKFWGIPIGNSPIAAEGCSNRIKVT
jgi:hypothetical protein